MSYVQVSLKISGVLFGSFKLRLGVGKELLTQRSEHSAARRLLSLTSWSIFSPRNDCFFNPTQSRVCQFHFGAFWHSAVQTLRVDASLPPSRPQLESSCFFCVAKRLTPTANVPRTGGRKRQARNRRATRGKTAAFNTQPT